MNPTPVIYTFFDQLENSGDLPNFSEPEPITYWNAVYFLMVTMSTGLSLMFKEVSTDLLLQLAMVTSLV